MGGGHLNMRNWVKDWSSRKAENHCCRGWVYNLPAWLALTVSNGFVRMPRFLFQCKLIQKGAAALPEPGAVMLWKKFLLLQFSLFVTRWNHSVLSLTERFPKSDTLLKNANAATVSLSSVHKNQSQAFSSPEKQVWGWGKRCCHWQCFMSKG